MEANYCSAVHIKGYIRLCTVRTKCWHRFMRDFAKIKGQNNV